MTTVRSRERGLTLVEILVAVAILAVAITLALVLYDAARKSFKKGENVTEQQQAVRIAFDRLNADLRMAGFNYNPDGDRARPDEQIEGAYDTSVVIRGDFDAEDATLRSTPESSLAGGAYSIVSTGNDEIVAYVLAKPDGSSTDTLTFNADVSESQRDGDVEQVSIPNVALVQNNPPYTLYRVTLNNNTGTFGTSGFITRTPLVENVRSMTFRYFDTSGVQTNATFDLTTTSDDIGGAETTTAKGRRGNIRRIGIDLVGLTRDPDLQWVDTTDTNTNTRRYRKFQLVGDVTPRNLGMVGIRDINALSVPPTAPAAPTLTPGHCSGLYVSWPANPTTDDVVSYRVNYGLASGNYTGTRSSISTSFFLGGLANGTTYYVAIQAINSSGEISPMSPERSSTTSNTTTPSAPTNLTATTNLNGAVRLNFAAVTTNTAPLSGDPDSPAIRDLAGYRIYRSDGGGDFTPGTPIANETIVGVQSAPSYLDQGTINCQTYGYKVTAVDTCGLESAPTSHADGRATSTTAPQAPTGVEAFTLTATRVRVTWQPVMRDVNDASIRIDTYRIYRSRVVDGDEIPPVPETAHATVTGATTYIDEAAPTMGPEQRIYYWVTAVDACPNESAPSNPAFPTCYFGGTTRITTPANHAQVVGVVTVRVQASGGGGETYDQAEFVFTPASGSSTSRTITGPGTACSDGGVSGVCWEVDWLANPPGDYTITATVRNTSGCTRSSSIQVRAGSNVGCCLSPTPYANPYTTSCARTGSPSRRCENVSYDMINNNCRTQVRMESVTIAWVSPVAGARLTGVIFPVPQGTIWSAPSGVNTPASNTFTGLLPYFDAGQSGTVTYTFLANNAPANSSTSATMTTYWNFRLYDAVEQPTAITGTCGPADGFNFVIPQQ